MRLRLLTIHGLIIAMTACTDNSEIVESERYKNEEVKAYNHILNDIADTTQYAIEGKVAIFFLFDSLTEIDNRSTGDYESEKEYLELRAGRRNINPNDLNSIRKYKFIRATSYPKDSIAGTTMYTKLQDPIKINDGEFFTRRWLTLSRICFDKNFEKGFLYYKSWCGNLCSHNDRLDIEKVNGKWKLKTRQRGPVS